MPCCLKTSVVPLQGLQDSGHKTQHGTVTSFSSVGLPGMPGQRIPTEGRCGVQAGWAFTHLHKHPPAEPCLHQRLGHPAGSIRCRAVHLGVVLPGEGAPAVCPPAAVGVHDDLSASDTGVPLWRKRKTRSGDVRGGVAKTLGWPLDHNLETVSTASRSVCFQRHPWLRVSQKAWALIPVQSLSSSH